MKKFGGSVHDDLTTDKDLPCDLARPIHVAATQPDDAPPSSKSG